MEFRMMSNIRNCTRSSLLAAALGLLVFSCAAGTVNGATGTFKKLFVFGDSYVDTGNRDPSNSTYTPIGPVNQAWRPPYGRKWPGYPAGHFSDGYLLSEFLGNYMGLKPATYRKYKLYPSTPICDGINFAVGGSGVFDNLGFTKAGDQIAQFKKLLDANVYGGQGVDFAKSAVLFAISGNDYAAYGRSLLTMNVTLIITAVVNQMVRDIQSLYDLGFRDFVISEIGPLDCLPSATATTNYTACVTPLAAISTGHNLYLTAAIAASFPSSKGAKFLFLDNEAAFYYILNNPVLNGFDLSPLKPCCVAQSGTLCGDLDSNDRPRYTLCSTTSTPFFWDENHPTEAGWKKVFNLYVTDKLFTHAESLPTFLGVAT